MNLRTSLDYDLYCLDELSLSHDNKIKEVIRTFQEVSSEFRLDRTDKIVMNVDTGNGNLFRHNNISPFRLNIMNKELDELLKLGVLELSHSPWNNLVLLV